LIIIHTFFIAVPTKENDDRKSNGYLLPPPVFDQPNKTCLSIVIEKIDIKDAGFYIDPFLKISVKGFLNIFFLF
jgi:hypothetical protein